MKIGNEAAKGLKETRINGQLHVKAIKHSGFFFINLCIFPLLDLTSSGFEILKVWTAALVSTVNSCSSCRKTL